MKKNPGKLSFSKITALLCSLFTLSLTSCLDVQDSGNPSPRAVTYLAIYHGSPDAPDVDIFVDDTRINNQGFKYADYSNYFNFVSPGNRKLKLTPVNASNAFVDTTLNFADGKIYSLFMVNQLQNMKLLVVKDSLISPGTGEAALRVLQLSPDAPELDVALVKSSTSTPFSTNMDYEEYTPFRKVTSGTHTVQVRSAENQELLLTVPNITLETGRSYSFLIRGFASPPSGNPHVLSMQVVRNY